MVLLKKLLNSWFDEIFVSVRDNFSFIKRDHDFYGNINIFPVKSACLLKKLLKSCFDEFFYCVISVLLKAACFSYGCFHEKMLETNQKKALFAFRVAIVFTQNVVSNCTTIQFRLSINFTKNIKKIMSIPYFRYFLRSFPFPGLCSLK